MQTNTELPRSPGHTMMLCVALVLGLATFQFLLFLLWMFVGGFGHDPSWRYVELFQFPVLTWTAQKDGGFRDLPALARFVQIVLALAVMILPPIWALGRHPGKWRMPFFPALWVHLALSALCTGLFLACGFTVYWDTL